MYKKNCNYPVFTHIFTSFKHEENIKKRKQNEINRFIHFKEKVSVSYSMLPKKTT